MRLIFINKTSNGRNNVCGTNITLYRKALKLSQKKLADKLQLAGLNVDKNAIQRIESGARFVTDIELIYLAEALGVSITTLLKISEET